MKEKALQISLVLASIVFSSQQLLADIKITEPIGGQNISADKALNSTNGAGFVALGNIVLTEAVPSDFSPGANRTLILSAPDGWRFNAAVGGVSFQGSRDITAASILVTSSNLTVTCSVGGAAKSDILTISGIQVQPLSGANAPNPGYIQRLSANPGTALIAGIVNDATIFGFCNTLPGAARTLAIRTRPGPNTTAGMLFDPQPEISTLDQFGNSCYLDTTTVVTATRSSGTPTLQGTLKQTAIGGLASFTDLSLNVPDTITIRFTGTNVAGVTSDPIVVAPAPADRLVFAVQPGAATAGAPLGVQPVLKSQDRFGNFTTQGLAAHQDVTLTLTSGSGAVLGAAVLDIGTSAGNGTVSFTNLRIDAAGTNKQLTASSAGFVNIPSSMFTVNPAAFTGLQLLIPGETAAPATPSGKTGLASAQVAGISFNVTINAVDSWWNVINTVTDTVGIASSDSNAAIPANAALVNGAKTISVTLKTAGNATITASDISNPSKGASTSPLIAVNPGAFTKLQLLVPGETAVPGTAAGKIGTPVVQTAGIAFNAIIKAVDANWNPLPNINDVVSLTCSDLNASLPASATLSSGTATLSVTPRTAGSSTLTAKDITDTAKTANSSPAISIAPGPFAQLQLLVPGETAAPGTPTGKTGAPSQQIAGELFAATVNAVDTNWNKVTTATDLIKLNSSDANPLLPENTSLVAGAQTLNLTLNTLGSATITAADLSDSSKTPATSPAISVAAPLFTAATGGEAISADGAGAAYTALTGPTYTEAASGNVGIGTIILKAPPGFIFDTASPLPKVLINGAGGKSYNLNGVANGGVIAMSSVTTTQLVLTVTKKSSGGFACKLTWQNLRVRPVAGTPLASGNLRVAGTAALLTASTNSNFGLLREIPGAARKFAIQTQPSPTAIAGMPFDQQPVLQILDKFGNFRANDSATVVTASRDAGSGALQGQTAMTASGGVVTFADLSHNVATNITLLFSSPGATNLTSSPVAVSPAAATALAFAVQPGKATAGAIFGVQPVVVTQDAFGNNSTVALARNLNVDVSLSAGVGPLKGTALADIGTSAGNGIISFSDLRIDAAGANQQLKASANGLVKADSSFFTVNPGAASQLVIQTQPSTGAEAGVAFPQQPAVRVADAFGNLRTSDNSTVVTATRNLGAAPLLGTTTATASSGVATFANLSYTNVETINLSFSSGSFLGAISSSINVGPGPARKLRILTQPSSTATAGQVFAQQPQIRIEDQFGNLRSADNSTVVSASRGAGTGALQGTTSATASAGAATFAGLSYPVAETMKILFTSGSASNALSSDVVVGPAAFAKLQILAPGEAAAPGTVTGKTGTPTAQIPDAAFLLTVNAVDTNWNRVSSVTDSVAISSSDIFATLPTNAALVLGTRQFSAKLSETGTNSFTASDLTDGSKAPAPTSGIPVNARYTSAIGGSAIPASTAGGAFTSLTGPTYSEQASAEAGKGTIILKAPAGFVFDTAGAAPNVKIERIAGIGKDSLNINGVSNGTAVAMSSVNSTQLVFTVTVASSSVKCKLTWQNVRVRPTASSPLAAGKLTTSGTSPMVGVTNGLSNLGTLREVLDGPVAQSPQGFGLPETLPSMSSASLGGQSALIGNSGDALTSTSPTALAAPAAMTGISVVGSTLRITFNAAPGYTYDIERASALLGSSASWEVLGSVTADSLGTGVFTDINPPALQGYYRTKQSQQP